MLKLNRKPPGKKHDEHQAQHPGQMHVSRADLEPRGRCPLHKGLLNILAEGFCRHEWVPDIPRDGKGADRLP
jgi:hypothetical protein